MDAEHRDRSVLDHPEVDLVHAPEVFGGCVSDLGQLTSIRLAGVLEYVLGLIQIELPQLDHSRHDILMVMRVIVSGTGSSTKNSQYGFRSLSPTFWISTSLVPVNRFSG